MRHTGARGGLERLIVGMLPLDHVIRLGRRVRIEEELHGRGEAWDSSLAELGRTAEEHNVEQVVDDREEGCEAPPIEVDAEAGRGVQPGPVLLGHLLAVLVRVDCMQRVQLVHDQIEHRILPQREGVAGGGLHLRDNSEHNLSRGRILQVVEETNRPRLECGRVRRRLHPRL
eukprot:5524757-Prymnesium_polylepis.3